MQYWLMASYPHCLITPHRGQEPRLGGDAYPPRHEPLVAAHGSVVLVLGWDEYFASTVVDAPAGHWFAPVL